MDNSEEELAKRDWEIYSSMFDVREKFGASFAMSYMWPFSLYSRDSNKHYHCFVKPGSCFFEINHHAEGGLKEGMKWNNFISIVQNKPFRKDKNTSRKENTSRTPFRKSSALTRMT